ncbi:MAG TPA: GDP-mannose 4,6-dehydratase, partial [Desulfomonilaceae bacterium]|nr:GDP-mannose 4,6-dehydratase [Desulfomonilaceae bacterium]
PVFVTGATGLLGSWLVRRLVSLAADVVCLVRDWVPQCELVTSGLIEHVKVVRGDVRDQALLERILGEYEIVSVAHLAAQTTVGVANRNPVSTLDVNIRGTWSLLEACRRSPLVKQIVIASSDKAYGDQKVLPYTEATALQGRHPYDVSKSCADLIAQAYAHTYKLPVCITRCGNFFGGGDLNWNRIVPGTIRSIIRNERPVLRSDGSLVRDYIYVEDGASAYTLLTEQMAEKPVLYGESFNFSNGIRLSVLEMVTKLLELMGSSLQPDIRNEAQNEIQSQYLDTAKAGRMLSWKPSFTLEQGLASTIRWYELYFESEAGR